MAILTPVRSLFLLPILLQTLLVPSQTLDLVILHTNDVHSRIEQFNSLGGDCSAAEARDKECYGGVARRQTQIKEEKAASANVLLLDAGDEFTGTVWFYHYQGEAAAHFMNMMAYDAMALGHHEFDIGSAGLQTFLNEADFDVLSCNLDASKENQTVISGLYLRSIEIEFDGEKVGIIGFSPQEAAGLVDPVGFARLRLLDQVEEVQKIVDVMTSQGINIIIALGHQGFDKDIEMAKSVKGIDIIVGGRSNTFLYTGDPPSQEEPVGPYPYVVNATFPNEADGSVEQMDVLVVQDFSHGKYLGKLVVTFDDNGFVTASDGNPILLDGNIAEDEEMLTEVAEWKVEVSAYAEERIGTTRVLLDGVEENCRMKECNLGNLVTDAMLFSHLKHTPQIPESWSDVSVAMWNSGAIRDSISDGEVNFAQLFSVFPFRNTMDIVFVKGSTILEILEQSVSNWDPDDPSGAFLQVAGLEVEYDVSMEPGQRVRNVNVRCSACLEPHYIVLDEDQTYGIVMSSFLLNGGDGYTMIREQMVKQESIGRLATDALTEYIGQYSPIMHGLDGRINFCGEDGCHVEPLRDTKCNAASVPVSVAMVMGVAALALLW